MLWRGVLKVPSKFLRKEVKNSISLDRINDRQRLFCSYYLGESCLNASDAAKRAGYKQPRMGHRLLQQPLINRYISKMQQNLRQAQEVIAERVITELGLIGLYDPIDMFAEDGELLQIHEMPERIRRCISSIDCETRWQGEEPVTTTKIKLHSKVASLDMLGKFFGMFDKTVGSPQATNDESLVLRRLLERVKDTDNVIDAEVINA